MHKKLPVLFSAKTHRLSSMTSHLKEKKSFQIKTFTKQLPENSSLASFRTWGPALVGREQIYPLRFGNDPFVRACRTPGRNQPLPTVICSKGSLIR